jgi:hypothetical protein
MTVYTSRFGFQWNYAPHATGWGDGYNAGFRTLSALLHPLLISDIVDTPPSSPIEGDAYFTPSTSVGAWAPYANRIAVWQGGAWWFYPPVTGMRVYFVNHIGFYFWNGATWSPEINLVSPPGSVLSVAGHPPDGAGNVNLAYSDISGAAPLSSPGFSGIPSGPTAASHNNSTQLATTAYVDGALNTLGGVVTLTQGTGIIITGTGGAMRRWPRQLSPARQPRPHRPLPTTAQSWRPRLSSKHRATAWVRCSPTSSQAFSPGCQPPARSC